MENKRHNFEKPKKRKEAVSSATAPHCSNASFAVTAKLFKVPTSFLVDTGADVSVLPSKFQKHAAPFNVELKAANGTSIKTYGCLTADVNIQRLRRDFRWKFVVADVTSPILGANFLDRTSC